ncbi:MAG: peptide ABC transporter substrate-binding protein [Treponema sp.]|nr:peptide ABC transporter substrate-binding protein [Treponema sp.]
MKKLTIRFISLLIAASAVVSQGFADAKNQKNQQNDSVQAPSDMADVQKNMTLIMAEQDFNLNPHIASYSSEAQILENLYEGVFSYDPKTLEPVPALAESYKISRNKKRWTLTIRADAKFSTGEKITAARIRQAWLDLLKTPGAPYASLLDCITNANEFRNGKCKDSDVGIIARDDKTLVVNLVTPTSHLSRILCHHAFAAYMNTNPQAYSGAYALSSKTGDTFVLERNKNYWDAKNVRITKITIISSSDLTENTWKFNTGEADWVSNMVSTQLLLNKNSMQISAIFGTEYIFFSCKNSPCTDADFRNALIAAVPWDKLRAGILIPATNFIYPLSGYPLVEGLSDTSIEDAKELMAEARAKLKIPKNQKIKLTFGIAESSERQKMFVETLKAAWAPLGVELVPSVTTEDRYISSIPGWNADIFTYSWIGDFADPLAFLELFRDGSTLNVSNWKNEKYTECLNKAAEETDVQAHYKLLSQAEQILLDDGEVLPVAHSVSLHAIDVNCVGGWYSNPLDIHPYKYLYFKKNPPLPLQTIVLAK